MSRLDELYDLRRAIDVEIERELASLHSMANLRDAAVDLLATTRSATVRLMLAVAQTFDVPVDDVTGRTRTRPATEARQVLAWLLRHNGHTFPEIGREIGGRDHTTAMHACAKVDATPRLRNAAHSIARQLIAPVQREVC